MRDPSPNMRISRDVPGSAPEAAAEPTRAVARLVASLRPERIYLFGSHAGGAADQDSDIDLLVVVAASDLPSHQRDQVAHAAIGLHILPLDIAVITCDEFERRQRVPSSLPATVLLEGRLIYSA